MEIVGPDRQYYRIETSYLGLSLRNRLKGMNYISFGFAWEEQASEAAFYTFSNSSRDRLLVGSVGMQKDSRDYQYYPSTGSLLRLNFQANGMLNEQHVFFLEEAEWRKYYSLDKVILASRLTARSSQYSLPYYRRFTLSRREVRARLDDFTDGWFTFSTSGSIRRNLLPVRYFSMGWVPLAGPYLLNLRYSVESVCFIDYGYAQFTSSGSKRDKDIWAYGGGFQFQVSYVQCLFAVLGWRPQDSINHPSLTVGAGVTF